MKNSLFLTGIVSGVVMVVLMYFFQESLVITILETTLIFAGLFYTRIYLEQGKNSAIIVFFTGYLSGTIISAIAGTFFIIIFALLGG